MKWDLSYELVRNNPKLPDKLLLTKKKSFIWELDVGTDKNSQQISLHIMIWEMVSSLKEKKTWYIFMFQGEAPIST